MNLLQSSIAEMLKVIPVLVSFFAFLLTAWMAFLQNKVENKSFATFFLAAFLMLVLSLISLLYSEFWVWVFNCFCSVFIAYLLFKILYQKNLQGSQDSSVLNKTSSSSKDNDLSQAVKNAQMQERSRIYANIHDDVGAKLLELVYRSSDETSKKLAKDVLQTLRKSVASTENVQFNVEQFAANLIEELNLRLQSANQSLVTTENLQNPKKRMPIKIPVALSRIFREVCSNAIKHSQAEQFSLKILSDETQLKVVFADNGIGLQKKQEGKGLKTIQKRADSISAKINWKSTPQNGTEFELVYEY